MTTPRDVFALIPGLLVGYLGYRLANRIRAEFRMRSGPDEVADISIPLLFKSDEDYTVAIRTAYPQVSAALAQRIVEVAQAVGADPFALANLINFESAGFNPKAINYNKNGTIGAVGLIQWRSTTAKDFGLTLQQILQMSAVEQMTHVERYLMRYVKSKGPLDTPQRLAMAIFYPAAITKSPDYLFPGNIAGTNSGIQTPADYVAKMTRNAKLPNNVPLYA